MKKLFKALALALPMVLALASCSKEKTVLTDPAATAAVKSHSMTISWTAVPEALSYTYRFADQAAVTTKETSITFDGLKSNTKYDFYIKAISDGTCVDSEEKQFSFTTAKEVVDFTAEITAVSFDKIDITFNSSEDVDHVNWYLGSQFTIEQDEAQFEAGKYTGVLPEEGGSFSITAKEGLVAGAPVFIIMQAVSIDGEKSNCITLYTSAGPVLYNAEKVSLGSFVADVFETTGSDYIGMGFYAFVPEEAESWGMTTTELAQTLGDWGMIDIVEPGYSKMITLNGQPEVKHCLAIYYFDANYMVKDIKVLDYTSGKFIDGAPEATIGAEIQNLRATSADLVFTPGTDTYGYVYRLYTKADYDESVKDAQELGFNEPLEYIRQVVDAYGSRNYKSQTDNRDALNPTTDYVLVCFPYNINGCQGWGKSVVVNFTTPADPIGGAPAAFSAQSVSETAADTPVAKLSRLLGKVK